jgi:hypothetical protein
MDYFGGHEICRKGLAAEMRHSFRTFTFLWRDEVHLQLASFEFYWSSWFS